MTSTQCEVQIRK